MKNHRGKILSHPTYSIKSKLCFQMSYKNLRRIDLICLTSPLANEKQNEDEEKCEIKIEDSNSNSDKVLTDSDSLKLVLSDSDEIKNIMSDSDEIRSNMPQECSSSTDTIRNSIKNFYRNINFPS